MFWYGKRLSELSLSLRRLSELSLSLRRLAVLVATMVTTVVANAQPANVTEAEMAVIPQFCRLAMAEGIQLDSRYRAYVQRWGEGFRTVHHFCWGQIHWLRALRSGTPDNVRNHLLHTAYADYAYVAINSPPDFVLLPEVYTRMGQVALRRSLPNDADKAFAKARSLKPDYWPAYSHWVEHLITSGQRSEALAVVKAGLEHSPSSKVLKAQYRLLSGKSAP